MLPVVVLAMVQTGLYHSAAGGKDNATLMFRSNLLADPVTQRRPQLAMLSLGNPGTLDWPRLFCLSAPVWLIVFSCVDVCTVRPSELYRFDHNGVLGEDSARYLGAAWHARSLLPWRRSLFHLHVQDV